MATETEILSGISMSVRVKYYLGAVVAVGEFCEGPFLELVG